MLKTLEPYIFENSKLPVWLSKIAPIEIYAFSFFVFVWCRSTLLPQTKRHEIIHFQQQLEMLFVFQWIFYGLFWLIGMIRYRDGRKAYYENPFEREAYDNELDENYLQERPRYAWLWYVGAVRD